ncbi:10107_t:CDS:2 [Ambispora leptoticha]|uniref:10107_t:CDS:1 n=1 Tax=Ambispora leptoticha TaxID=144679 RepID=A0A9N9H8K1_9GLOM|nr:10107_t:CDS:2 [Ambispora leptoticha]
MRIPRNVDKFEVPKDKQSLQRFLGFMNYFRSFILDFAKIASPLYERVGNKDFDWTPKCQQAMDMLKREIKRVLELSYPDPHQPFFMETDASDKAVGAILYQIGDKSRDHWKIKEEIKRKDLLREQILAEKDYSKRPSENIRIIKIGSTALSETQRK